MRICALVVVWIAGLAAGFFGLLSASAKYTTCGTHSKGLACGTTGTALGALLVVGIISTVSATTVLTHGKSPREVALWSAGGVGVLVICYYSAQALLGTA